MCRVGTRRAFSSYEERVSSFLSPNRAGDFNRTRLSIDINRRQKTASHGVSYDGMSGKAWWDCRVVLGHRVWQVPHDELGGQRSYSGNVDMYIGHDGVLSSEFGLALWPDLWPDRKQAAAMGKACLENRYVGCLPGIAYSGENDHVFLVSKTRIILPLP